MLTSPHKAMSLQQLVCCGALLLAAYISQAHGSRNFDFASIASRAVFLETFNEPSWSSRWKHSTRAGYDGRFDVWKPQNWADPGIQMPTKNMRYGAAAMLDAPLEPAADGLVLQYEVRYTVGSTCGGAYVKLLAAAEEGWDGSKLAQDTPYSIMFGPDKCGSENKVRFILGHQAANGSMLESHSQASVQSEVDTLTHVYTLHLHTNGTYRILVDGRSRTKGRVSNAKHMQPPLVPPRQVPSADASSTDGAGMVPNPEYDPDLARAPLSHVPAVVAVALELWTTDSGYTFDNILITTSPAMAEELRLGLWRPRHDAELAQVEQLRAAAGAAEQDKGASKARALQEEKDAEMRARRAAEANGGGDGKGLARRIVTSVEEGRLRRLRPLLRPLLPALHTCPWIVYLLLSLPPLGWVLIVASLPAVLDEPVTHTAHWLPLPARRAMRAQAREQGVEPWLDKNNSAVGKGGTGPSATADEGTTAKAPAATESQDDASAALPVK